MYHKDLEVYKKSIELVKNIYEVTAKFPSSEQFGLVMQLRRAVVSIPSNIAEGNARNSDKETSRFVDIALGSLAEVDTQLLIAKELNFVTNEIYEQLLEQFRHVQALLIGLKSYFQNKEKSKGVT